MMQHSHIHMTFRRALIHYCRRDVGVRHPDTREFSAIRNTLGEGIFVLLLRRDVKHLVLFAACFRDLDACNVLVPCEPCETFTIVRSALAADYVTPLCALAPTTKLSSSCSSSDRPVCPDPPFCLSCSRHAPPPHPSHCAKLQHHARQSPLRYERDIHTGCQRTASQSRI